MSTWWRRCWRNASAPFAVPSAISARPQSPHERPSVAPVAANGNNVHRPAAPNGAGRSNASRGGTIDAVMISSEHRLAAVLADNFRWACRLHAATRVRRANPSDSPTRTQWAARFLAGASAAAPLLSASDPRVGQRIEAAATAMRQATGNDDSLGILLLCAPIAAAAWRMENTAAIRPPHRSASPENALREALQAVLYGFDETDAVATLRAIALADPTWLADSPVGEDDADTDIDAGDIATMDLRRAMTMAAPRDRIALQYITDFDDLFDPALREFVAALGEPPSADRMDAAMEDVCFGFVTRFADARIFRTHGPAVAQEVVQRARAWRKTWGTALGAMDADPGHRIARAHARDRWDADLHASGIEPATSGDLAVATAFLAACLDHRLRALGSPAGCL
jgi:triphosphoribosyl-dephospho-CoA synthase